MDHSKKTRICLVEDEEIYADLLQEEIDKTGDIIFVNHYTSAIEALDKLPEDQPNVVLMDIDLKEEINGIECMFRVKEKIPHAHFIMFTVFDENELLFNALRSGADGYVLKRDFHILIPAIREILKGGAPMSREIARKVTASFKAESNTALEQLTKREMEVLEKISQGFLNKEIAEILGISEGGIKQHLYRIYKKLQVNNRVEATQKYWGK